MTGEPSFRDLIARVRAGDQAAAADLVRDYEPEIRRYVRLHLTSPSLRRILDSDDICQSVLTHFFVGLVTGRFDLDEPGDLIRLLVTMTHNKIVDHARKPATRRNRDWGSAFWARLHSTGQSPSDIVATEEMLKQVRDRLTEEELALIEQRNAGVEWKEIAEAAGIPPEALRKRLKRALERVCRDLGVDKQSYA